MRQRPATVGFSRLCATAAFERRVCIDRITTNTAPAATGPDTTHAFQLFQQHQYAQAAKEASQQDAAKKERLQKTAAAYEKGAALLRAAIAKAEELSHQGREMNLVSPKFSEDIALRIKATSAEK